MTETAQAPALADRVRELVGNGTVQLPPLPELAIELQRLLADERVDAERVAQLVHSDAAIASTLLRFANSAAYGGLREVTDLRQAVARLGFRQVGSMVTTLLLKSNMTAGVGTRRKLLQAMWNQSVSVASCAKELSERADVDPEEAYLAGLLHDCGRLAILKATDHLIEHEPDVSEIPGPLLDEMMEELHCEIGHLTLSSWKLPESICEVALRHEEPCDESTPSLILCIQASTAISRKLGFHVEPDEEIDLTKEPSVQLVGIADIELAVLMVDLEDCLEEAVEQLGVRSE